MNEIYFPSCNFTKDSPEAARRIRAYLKERMPVAGCCRIDKLNYTKGSTALYFCQACRETLETRVPEQFTLQNLFVYLTKDSAFPWPDYSGLTATVQDCWRDRDHPEIFEAVRTALEKMRVSVVEMEENKARSVYCGTLHFEPKDPQNASLLAKQDDKTISHMPKEVQLRFMREQVEKFPCEPAVTCCNRCTAGIRMAGGKGVHLMELMMGTYD
ncbi:MAG: hypothetical protein HFG69_17210 [Hungatella sp.]|nr:hypothetical protein [Hungatella sp.]